MEALFVCAQVAILTYAVILPLTIASKLVLYLTGRTDATITLPLSGSTLELETVVLLALALGMYAVVWPRGHQSSLMIHVVKSAAVALFIVFGLAALLMGSGGSLTGAGEMIVSGLKGTSRE